MVGVFAVFLRVRKNCSRTLYSSMIIVNSLQLCERKQIAKPRKYCLVRVIIFFGVYFLYFFVSHRLGIRVNSLQWPCQIKKTILHFISFELSSRLRGRELQVSIYSIGTIDYQCRYYCFLSRSWIVS